MLNIRTFTFSIGLAAIFLLTVAWAFVRTETVSPASSKPASVPEIQGRLANLNETYKASSYRSQFGECFDVPIRDLAACRNANQAAIQVQNSAVDQCFDVSLWEVTSCRKVNEESVP